MTTGARHRGKAPRAAREPAEENVPTGASDKGAAKAKDGSRGATTGKPKLSREALALQASLLVNTGVDDAPGARARGRASAQHDSHHAPAEHRARKGVSDPPLPSRLLSDREQAQEQLGAAAAAHALTAAPPPVASGKRAAVDSAQPGADGAKPSRAKKQKVARALELEPGPPPAPQVPQPEPEPECAPQQPGGSQGTGPAERPKGASADPVVAGGRKRSGKKDISQGVMSSQPDSSAHDASASVTAAAVDAAAKQGAPAAGAKKPRASTQGAAASGPGPKPEQEQGAAAAAPAAAQAPPAAAAAPATGATLPDALGSAAASGSQPLGAQSGKGRRGAAVGSMGAAAAAPAPASAPPPPPAQALPAAAVADPPAAPPPARAAGKGGRRSQEGGRGGAAAVGTLAAPAAAEGAGAAAAAAGAAAAAVLAAAGRPLPATGSTPVKAFAPIPIPRLDELGQRERGAVVDLQRQLSELRAQYDELKATKIQELEKVLAEQVEYTQEQVAQVEQRARLWQAAAEHAEQKAKAAGSQETTERIAALEVENEQLLSEKAELLLCVAQHERELAATQQALHDLRAELLRYAQPPGAAAAADAAEEMEGGAAAAGAAVVEAGGVEGVEQAAPREAPDAEAGGAAHAEGAVPGQDEASPMGPSHSVLHATPAAGGTLPVPRTASAPRGVGLQFPTPSPGVGVQFPTPGLSLPGLQGLLGAALTAPGSGSRSGGPGVSTECQRIVDMLPHLRMPTPSVQSRQALGSVPAEVQADAARSTGRGADAAPATAQPPNKSRRSTGSPIDGICSVGQRTAGAKLAADVSFARGMGAPEGFVLGGAAQQQQQQDDYSFVDLNPASARKAARPSLADGTGAAAIAGGSAAGGPGATAGGERTQQGPERRADASAAALLAAAAATLLPPSPKPVAGQVPLATAGSGVLHTSRSPVRRSPRRQAAAPSPASVAAAVIHSGSLASNQDSCTVPGLVARAAAEQGAYGALQEERQQLAASSALQQQRRSPLRAVTPRGAAAAAQEGVLSARAGAATTPRASPTAPTGGALLARTPVAPSPSHGPKPGAAGAAAQQPREQPEAAGPPAAGAQGAHAPASAGPSPTSARLLMYERMLDWRVDASSLRPDACRLTHPPTGMAFELRECEMDDDEAAEVLGAQEGGAAAATAAQAAAAGDGGGGPPRRPTCLVYTPLELGSAAAGLPDFLKETIQFPLHQRRGLLDLLNKAIKQAAALGGGGGSA